MQKILSIVGIALGLTCLAPDVIAQFQSKKGNPEDHLPDYIKRVSGFGERPDWSHDGKKILFVEKPMGEVFELDLETGLTYPKTRHFNHYGFTRAMYLSNGDILLSGPIEPFDEKDPDERNVARDMCYLFVLDQSGSQAPMPLNEICAEGPAVSRSQLKIAWTIRSRQKPELGENSAQLFTGVIVYEEGIPKIRQRKMIFDSHQLPFTLGNSSLEVQSLVPPKDVEVTFTAYTINQGKNTDAFVVNSETGQYRRLTDSPEYYDEPEGIFPDGKFTCVEHGPSKDSAWPLIDIFKLKLDGSGEMQQLTNFSDYKGFKGSQGVVSDDGKFLCFQVGKSGDEAGVGYGFFIMDLEKASPHLPDFKSYDKQ